MKEVHGVIINENCWKNARPNDNVIMELGAIGKIFGKLTHRRFG